MRILPVLAMAGIIVAVEFAQNPKNVPDETMNPDEMIELISSFSGSMSDRPFVPPLTHPSIEYGIRISHDPVANLIRDIQSNKVRLRFDADRGYLRSVLQALKVPEESQIAVFSKTSVQRDIIDPENPRHLYFNDSVVVGSVAGGFIELAAQDPEQGINFYVLPQQPADKPFVSQSNECLSCHVSQNSLDIPGMLLRSVYPAPSGAPIPSLGSHLVDHRTPFEDRWGGFYVTGEVGEINHLGNTAFSENSESQPMLPNQTSDVVALMVFDHQTHMMNLLTRVGWDFRVASALEGLKVGQREIIDGQVRDDVNELVDYLLFVDEAPLKNGVHGASGFAEKFQSLGPADSKGRSLRQLDLDHRLMRYPCSYMIYAPAFDGLPGKIKEMIYSRMSAVLSTRFSSDTRQAVVEILRETKKDLPDFFR